MMRQRNNFSMYRIFFLTLDLKKLIPYLQYIYIVAIYIYIDKIKKYKKSIYMIKSIKLNMSNLYLIL